jgi:hypothetical protein
MEPYRRMTPRKGRPPPGPQHTLLATRALSPFVTVVAAAAALHRRAFVGLVAAVTCLAEALAVALVGLPHTRAVLERAWFGSFYASMAILAFMLLSQAALVLRRRSDPPLPRTPNTVAAVWSYLCASSGGCGGGGAGGSGQNGGGSTLLDDLADLGTASPQRRDALVRAMGRRYCLEKRAGADGISRWIVDYAQETTLSSPP